MTELLRPYVPRPVIDWLRKTPDEVHREVRGSFVFADISGFTALTEKLQRRGKVGSEEMGDVLNATFTQLLVPAYDYGAGLIKWGGDATLLLFEGSDHAARACRAAVEMQRVMSRIGRLRTSVGAVRLRMSIGVHSGNLDMFLVGSSHRELIVVGPGATVTTAMEQAAGAGQIVVSAGTADMIGPDLTGSSVGSGRLLTTPPEAPLRPERAVGSLPGCIDQAVPRSLKEHIERGAVDSEHRPVSTGFVQFLGTDDMLDAAGPLAVAQALGDLVDVTAAAAARHDVTFLASDIAANGGKLILVAGAPRSHDRSEERMLCTLREILDAANPLPLRGGVTSGRVFAGDFGPAYRRTYSIVGDSVNLAARLMAHAAPGRLLTTPTVLSRSRTRFVATELSPFAVKGKAEPVVALDVGQPVVREDEERIRQGPIVGRDEELAVMLGAGERLRRSEGHAFVVRGAGGAGKSRLVDELVRIAQVPSLRYSCDEFTSSTPYAAWRPVLNRILGLPADAASEDSVEVLVTTIDVRLPHLRRWLPLLGMVFDTDLPATPEVEALDERFRSARLAQVIVDLLTVVADNPTILIFDDVHLLDSASAEVLNAVARAAHERPWLVVCTRRDGTRGYLPSADFARLDLKPLDDGDAAHLLELATELDPLPPHIATELIRRAGGNPLFLLELVGARRRADDTDALPDTLESLLSSSIDALAPRQRALLRLAAVLGTRFERSLLDDVAAEEDIDVGPDDWARLTLFLDDDGRQVVFRDALKQTAAYEGLPFRRRVDLHRVAGAVLERRHPRPTDTQLAALSSHFSTAQDFPRALRYSRLAGNKARDRYAHHEASGFLARALEAARHLPMEDSELRAIAEALGDSRLRLGDLDGAQSAFLLARRHSRDDVVARGRITLLAAKARTRAGRMPVALAQLSIAISELDRADSDEARRLAARLCAWYAKIRLEQGKHRQAIHWARTAIARAEAVDARDVLAEAYQHLDRASIALGSFRHEELATRALEIWEELGELTWQGAILNHLGIRAYYLGHWATSQRYYERARDVLERIGDSWNAAIASYNVAEIYTEQGRLADADRVVRQSLRVFRASDTPGMIAFCHALLGRIAAYAGRYDDADAFFAQAREGFAADGEAGYVVETDARMLEAWLLEGRCQDVMARIDDTLASARTTDVVSIVPLLLRVRGCALAGLGDLPAAQQTLEASLSGARDFGSRADVARALEALIEIQAEPSRVSIVERDQLFGELGVVANRSWARSAAWASAVPAQATAGVTEPA